jgi:hypothetical protein
MPMQEAAAQDPVGGAIVGGATGAIRVNANKRRGYRCDWGGDHLSSFALFSDRGTTSKYRHACGATPQSGGD